MGFLTRLLIPRSVRRAVHPTRAVKRALTPTSVKRARRVPHPLDNAVVRRGSFAEHQEAPAQALLPTRNVHDKTPNARGGGEVPARLLSRNSSWYSVIDRH